MYLKKKSNFSLRERKLIEKMAEGKCWAIKQHLGTFNYGRYKSPKKTVSQS